MSKSKIEWTHSTWPVVTGCSHAGSPGCDMCYAARMAATRLKLHPRYAGLATIENGKARWTGEVRLNHDVLEQPLRWRKPRMIFVASMGDWLHHDIPVSFIFHILDITRKTPQHIYQFLTKRANRLPVIVKDWMLNRGLRKPPQNIWQGVSVENQAAADERREHLRQCPAAVKFVSYEPALDPVDWTGWEFVSQIISGGESGPGARPSHPNWHRATRDFCQKNRIAYFFKQWGAFRQSEPGDKADYMFEHDWHGNQLPVTMTRMGKKRAGRLLDGRTWQEFPR